jgi:hypothetical protein
VHYLAWCPADAFSAQLFGMVAVKSPSNGGGPMKITSTCKSQVRRRTVKAALWAAALVQLASNALAAVPGDATDGKRLHDANCTGCHDSGVYTRKTRSVTSLAALEKQLDGCAHVVKKEFTPAEKQNIVKYLNEGFYHFR